MKLEKFSAESMASVLKMVQIKLGDHAVIYSQTKTDKGIEVIAGLPKNDQEYAASQIKQPVASVKESLIVAEKKTSLLDRIHEIDVAELKSEISDMEKLNLLQLKLRQLKFPHDFIEKYSSMYASLCEKESILNNEIIVKILLTKIQVEETESIATKKICALVGPTGIGKSTTTAKLAKRFSSRYGANNVGIISTDFQRIITKNQFHYFGKLLNIQIEYAKDSIELREAIHVLDDKKIIFIDTAGVSQNDNRKLAELFEKLSNQITGMTSYLVLPCNLQSDILNDVVTNFKMPHTAGCIITKKDECKSIAPCLSVAVMHQLPIAYWCNGQNIIKDIHVPKKSELIRSVFHGEKNDRHAILSV